MFTVEISKGIDKNKIKFIQNGTYDFIGRTSVNYGIQGFVDKMGYEPNDENTFSIAQIGETVALFRKKKWYSSQNMFVLTPINQFIIDNHLFFESVFRKSLKKYSDAYVYPTLNELKNIILKLPLNENGIDYRFMNSFVAELEALHVAELEALHVAELEAYLTITGLKDYQLTKEEEMALEDFKSLSWKSFNLEDLFGKSSRGKRLKSDDRIPGDLPFVTAGEEDEGVSDFIGNNVVVFNKNTITIDMFGSAKYRNYKYGGDDHIAVVHTEKLNKYAAIFVTSAIHKSSHNGQFSYDKNFYAKDADYLNIMLPVTSDKPDYNYMKIIISAIHKIIIKEVVNFSDSKIETTKSIIKNL